MNCADVTRIANTGSCVKLTELERDAVSAHALTCRECAAVWATHTGLAGLRMPPMPAELSLRCQTLAAVGPQRVRSPSRRLAVVVGLAALAAAAAALLWYLSVRTPGSSEGAVATAAPVAPVAAEPVALAGTETATEPVQTRASEEVAIAPATEDLPLVPPPGPHVQDPKKSQLALQKAIERQPELVEGPPLDSTSTFIVSVTMKADGTVLNSAAELATPETYAEIANRLVQLLPVGGGEHIVAVADSGASIPDGRVLRSRVFLQGMIISDAFDMTRSNVRVREILGRKYDDFMTPHSSNEGNVLTVLLSDDGRILREKVERLTMQDAAIARGTATGTRQEDAIAVKLGVDVNEIGAIGGTTLEQGSPKIVVDADGLRHVEGMKRLAVRYAWTRRADESPAIQSPPREQPTEADFNLVAATVVAERLLPGAFSHSPPSFADTTSMPTVVFNARGEVIRAGRVQMRNGVDVDSLLQQQLVPGVSTGLHRSVHLTNREGATALFLFGWDY